MDAAQRYHGGFNNTNGCGAMTGYGPDRMMGMNGSAVCVQNNMPMAQPQAGLQVVNNVPMMPAPLDRGVGRGKMLSADALPFMKSATPISELPPMPEARIHDPFAGSAPVAQDAPVVAPQVTRYISDSQSSQERFVQRREDPGVERLLGIAQLPIAAAVAEATLSSPRSPTHSPKKPGAMNCLNGAFRTDADISSGMKTGPGGVGTIGGDRCREGRGLDIWEDLRTPKDAGFGMASSKVLDGTLEDLCSRSHGIDGWDQFEVNRKLFGVVSTYKDDLSQYTTPLDLDRVPTEVRERAQRVAREIEEAAGPDKRTSRNWNDEDINDTCDEEDLWSAVPRVASGGVSPLRTHPGNAARWPTAATMVPPAGARTPLPASCGQMSGDYARNRANQRILAETTPLRRPGPSQRWRAVS
jgi:hypothetical protein